MYFHNEVMWVIITIPFACRIKELPFKDVKNGKKLSTYVLELPKSKQTFGYHLTKWTWTFGEVKKKKISILESSESLN